jgi:hypothetical protein
MITFDIKDLYVNIPAGETLNITKTKLLQNNGNQTTHQIVSLVRTVLSQNYFTFQQRIYQPEQGISMGSPISSIIVGIVTDYGPDGPRIEARWGRDFLHLVQTGPGAHPASCTTGNGTFPGVKCGRGVTLTIHPLLVLRSRKSRAIPLHTLWATPGL